MEDEQSSASVLDKVEGDMQGGSDDIGEEVELCVKDIVAKEPRDKLAEATQADSTLATAKT